MNVLIKLLILQDIAGIITLAGVLVIFAVVFFLIVTSDKNEGDVPPGDNFFKPRGGYFWGTCLLLTIILFLTFKFLPHPYYQDKADEMVTVVGMQWDWQMAHGIINKEPEKFLGKNEISLPVNKRIKFIVTSSDVTHNFGIYTKTGVLLTQIQAMPEYRNELQYIFTNKGNYTILCLEYCGLAHPFMTGIIHVQ